MAPEEPTRSNDYVALVLTATDPSKCEVEFDLPAGYKVVIDLNSTCDDYPKQPAEQRSPLPFPSALRIEGKEGIIDLNGWQVARQFKRQKDDSCLLVYE